LTLNLVMTFNPAYVGTKNIYMFAMDVSGPNTGWQQLGTWTVPAAAGVPATVSVTPSSGSAASQTFVLHYSDSAGASSLQLVYVWFNTTLTKASNSCLLFYQQAGNQLNLLNDAATEWLTATPGAAATLQNSQCSLNAASTTVTLSGNTLTLNLPLMLKAAYAGAMNVYMFATDVSGANTGWQERGTWTIP